MRKIWLLILPLALLPISCDETSSSEEDSDLPVVKTTTVTEITSNSARSGGEVTSEGASEVFSCGVCWDTSSKPEIEDDSHTWDGEGMGSFNSEMEGLKPSTKYYLRAYATNDFGTSYGNEVTFTTLAGEVQPPQPITDQDGNSYDVVRIGDQDWTVTNWRSTKYNDGSAITLASDDTEWSDNTTGAYCAYSNTGSNATTYGYLYNWYAVNSEKLAPTGWRVPTESDWEKLATYLGGTSVAGGKMKATGTTYWESPNTDATNSSGFTALPNGRREYMFAGFDYLNERAYWWSSTATTTFYAYVFQIRYSEASLRKVDTNKNDGYGIRLVRDVQ